MDIFKRYTSAELLSMLKSCSKRFPVTVLFIILFTAFLLVFNHHGEVVSKAFNFICIYYLSTTILLSFSLHLWCEEFGNIRKQIIVQAIVHLLWILGAVYLYENFEGNLDINIALAYISAIVLTFISIFILSFLREKDDITAWNFTLRILLSGLIAAFIGLILAGGINLLFLSFQELFKLNISNEVYPDVFIICLGLIATILFLGLVPAGEEKHDHTLRKMNRFGHVVIYYLFIPLLASYIVTLYIYALQILLTWTLPTGWVSWLVTASMAGMLLIITLIYPTQFGNEKKIDRFVMRILPIIILPLLLLMTIGIIRRFNDYGFTVSRLYLLVFNLWCYAVCIGLFLLRSRRIRWIPASFGIILFLTSVGPQSMANITRNKLRSEITKIMDKSSVKHRPMNAKEYEQALTELDSTSVRRLNDKLDYLQDLYQKNTWGAFIDTTVVLNGHSYEKDNESTMIDCDEPTAIPEGFQKATYVTENVLVKTSDVRGDTIPLKVTYTINEKKVATVFPVSIQKMKELDHSAMRNKTWMLRNEEACLYVRNFTCSKQDSDRISMSVNGILFLK
jgi:hypothetical protein